MWRKYLAAAALTGLALLGGASAASAQATARIVGTCGTISPYPPLTPGTTGQLYMDISGKLCSTAVGGSSSFVWPGTAGNGTAGAPAPGGSTMPYVNAIGDIQRWGGAIVAAPTAPGSPATSGLVPTVNIANPGGGGGSFTWPGTAGLAGPSAGSAGTMPFVNAYLNGTLPPFAAPPTVNIGTGGPLATAANQTNGLQLARVTADGVNTIFSAAFPGRIACPDGTTACFGGSGGGTFTWPGTAGVAVGGAGNAGTMPFVNSYLNGTLPPFAATPTVNIGTGGTLATSANQTNGTQKAQPVDPSGNTLFSTGHPGLVACPDGTINCFVGSNAPFNYTKLSGGQYNVPLSTSTALTIPGGATYAVVCAEVATVRYTTSGTTPTAAIGIPLLASTSSAPCVPLQGPSVLAAFRAISAGGGTLDVEYFQ